MLKIYIDGMFFRLSGIGRCYENLLRALDLEDDVSRIFTIVPRSREEDFRRSFASEKIEAKFVDFHYFGVSDFLLKGFILRSFRPPPDVFFFPNIDVPLFWKGKTICQVHDLIPISRHSDYPWRQRYAFRMLAGRTIRKSHRIVCVSQFTKEEVMAEYRAAEDRIHVIHNWVDDGFIRALQRSGRLKPLVEGKYLLFVGNRSAHKNLKVLMEAFRRLFSDFPDLKVAVAGKRMRTCDDVDRTASDPNLGGNIVQFPDASDEQIMNLYAFAAVFVFPTFIEGFGIPPLEALASGIPVVCSDIPVIREVCGDAVRYADPYDPGSFAREIRSALLDAEKNSIIKETGSGRLSLYRKELSLSQYLELFRMCARR